MVAIASLLVGAGIIAFIIGGYLKFRGGRIAKTPLLPTGAAAQQGEGKISVQGAVNCPQPLIAPASGAPCLYYTLKVTGTWKEGDTTKSKTYLEEKHAAPFVLDDGSGPVHIDLTGGGDLDLKQTFNDKKKEGFMADIRNAVAAAGVGQKQPIMFGQFAFENPPLSKANEFHCQEMVVHPPQGTSFALGKVEGGRITSAGLLGMIFAGKTRDELIGATAKNTKMAFIGGGAATAIGVVLGVANSFMG